MHRRARMNVPPFHEMARISLRRTERTRRKMSWGPVCNFIEMIEAATGRIITLERSSMKTKFFQLLDCRSNFSVETSTIESINCQSITFVF